MQNISKNNSGRSILIRYIPSDIQKWVDSEKERRLMTQQELLLNILEKAAKSDTNRTGLEHDHLRDWAARPASFTFIDLFAGIGGFRIGLERAGGRCIFSCEWDKYSQKTYKAWFNEVPEGDIRKIKPEDIPDHDILAAGFPCQPFSIAGVSKKISLGRAHGFKDLSQGNLFFYLATIAKEKRPPVLALENVKNLKSHDKGRTWEIIESTLEDIGYRVFHKIIDGAGYVPQHRERIFIICFDRAVFGDNPPFQFPEKKTNKIKLENILEKKPHQRYTLSDHLWNYLKKYAETQKQKGNGFGFGLADLNGHTRTLSARYHKDGSEILIPQGLTRNPRRLTPREAARLMGFSDSLPIVVSDTQAYRQFGNAVIPLVTEAVGKNIADVLHWQIARQGNGCLVKGK
jgi:DNA (cytosine-5)-methyltransferase 1